MTQAHKTPGAFVVLSEWEENHHDWLIHPDGSRYVAHIYRVVREEPRKPSALHLH